ncbi:MAG TPA: hypothetical protein VGA73_07375, partial [Candidatus Binatia bacterium]
PFAKVGSAASLALQNAVDITEFVEDPPLSFAVGCDIDAAMEIRRIAETHCREALGEIDKAIRATKKM